MPKNSFLLFKLSQYQHKNIKIYIDLSHKSKFTPWARGMLLPQFIVQVTLLMYCFHESEPDYLPPPVYFSPPNAPPISAPEGPMLTFTIPQSDPRGPIHLQALLMFCVNKLLLKPWLTLLLIYIASYKLENLMTKRIGQKYSSLRNSAFLSAAIIVGST